MNSGYIDADTHVLETEQAWSYMDPGERQFAPVAATTNDEQQRPVWLVGDQILNRGAQFRRVQTVEYEARDLSDIPARLRWMDKLGVETQVIYTSFFLNTNIKRPEMELALARSYNRWLSDVYAESKGRLRWAAIPSLANMAATCQMLESCKRGGACGVTLRPIEQARVLNDPFFEPLFATAQDLDMPIVLHVGVSYPELSALNRNAAVFATTPMIGAFYTLLVSDVSERFPRLRFGFIEAASSWIPFALHRASRGGASSEMQHAEVRQGIMKTKRLFVACMADEDLPYILNFAGPDNLVLGSDFGHTDTSTEIEAHRLFTRRMDIPADVAKRIVSDNARTLYGL